MITSVNIVESLIQQLKEDYEEYLIISMDKKYENLMAELKNIFVGLLCKR